MTRTSQARLDQARRRYSALDGEIRVYLGRERAKVVSDLEDDRWNVIRFASDVVPPPLTLGVILGEVVHNLRAVLDNLVFDLAGQPTSNSRGQTAFPIAESSNDYLNPRRDGEPSMRERMLEGVPDGAREIIDAFQPFEPLDDHLRAAWGESQEHPLRMLRVLSNADKHRIAHPAALLGATPEITIPDPPPGEFEITFTEAGGPISDGVEIARFRHSDPSVGKVASIINTRVVVVFGANGVGLGDLDRLIRVVDWVVSRFEIVGQ